MAPAGAGDAAADMPAQPEGRRRSRRASAPPAGSLEPLEIRTEDGRALRADVREPPRGQRLHGVAVLAHAMFARRSEFERPRGEGLARFLAERGWRTIAFDFRGHGESGPGAAEGGSWTYDDLVTKDLPAVVACARARATRSKVVVVGHSLGGHVAVASQGTSRLGADAIVCVAANVWTRAQEPSIVRWGVKRATLALIARTCERRGYLPVRALRLGSDDEASAYFAALCRFAERGVWGSDDGRDDYAAAAGSVKVPVMQIASDGDRLNCAPACAERFLSLVGGERCFERIGRADDGGRAPGHMALVTSDAATSAWARAEAWMRRPPR
jgi:predicted alpha/beta hydrolase